MKAFAAALCAALVTACASSGIVNTGQGVYMVSKGPAGPGVPGSVVLADLYAEANAHCDKAGQALQTVSATSVDPVPFVRAGSAKLEFRCAPK